MINAWNTENHLQGTGSPYLEQHADNPVNWVPWGEEAFEAARNSDIPLLVSIGYSTCHWCHVMAHESFENPLIAKVMNASQVNIKVDREQHPGVDAIYMEAAQAMTGSGGWPLNVFIDHDGRPFLAVTYLPPDRWTALVKEVHRIWNDDRDRVHDAAASLTAHLEGRSFPSGQDPSDLPRVLMDSLRRTYDSDHPGFAMGSQVMKFPPAQSIDWLLEHGGEDGRAMALEILTAMMDSGLHDRVGGGFHRYSVDAEWRVPHFEKMAYDNAQLMGLYARAASLTDSATLGARFLSTARGTADWFLEEMRVTDTDGSFLGYATATDADDALGEGTYFAWPPEVLKTVLGEEDASWLAQRWNLFGDSVLPDTDSPGHFEPVAGWIPHPRSAADYPEGYRPPEALQLDPDYDRELSLLPILKSVRSGRPSPARDDKVLTDQNALILEGLVRLARYGGGEQYLSAARELAELLKGRIDRDESSPSDKSQLFRAPGIEAYITDYGYLSMALAGAYSLLGDLNFLHTAEAVAREALSELAVGDGSFYSSSGGDSILFKRAVEEFDGPSPAGAHALGIAFARLYAITGSEDWRNAAYGLLAARAAVGAAAPGAATTLVRLASIYSEPYILVVAGPSGHAATEALLKLTRRYSGPDLMVVAADEAADAGEKWTELEGRVGLERPQLLVCREGSCLLPAFTSEEVIDRLKQIGRKR